MSLTTYRARLEAISKEIALQWEETRKYWNDAKGQEFGHQYMEQLLLQMGKAAAACEKLDQIVSKARHECE